MFYLEKKTKYAYNMWVKFVDLKKKICRALKWNEKIPGRFFLASMIF